MSVKCRVESGIAFLPFYTKGTPKDIQRYTIQYADIPLDKVVSH